MFTHNVKQIPPTHIIRKKSIEGMLHHFVGVMKIRVGNKQKFFTSLMNEKCQGKWSIYGYFTCHTKKTSKIGNTSFWSKSAKGSSGSGSTKSSGLDIISLYKNVTISGHSGIKWKYNAYAFHIWIHTLSWPSTWALKRAFPTAWKPCHIVKRGIS